MLQRKQSEIEESSCDEVLRSFECEARARHHVEAIRWRSGRECPRCGSKRTTEASHRTMPYWCRDCRKYFSVKTGTLMEGSNIGIGKWLMAIRLLGASLNGASSAKLGSVLGISQQSAWFMARRIRSAWTKNFSSLFDVSVKH